MLILGIETSCDETSVALVRDGKKVLATCTHTQILDHAHYGGVIPELASRKHCEFMMPVLEKTLQKTLVLLEEVDAIAVTQGPGLLGSLLVGVNTAKTLAYLLNKPCIPVDHLMAHLYAPWLSVETLEFPILYLTVSGGHTSLVLMRSHRDFSLLGQTLDDSAGEAFDKASVLLGLGYPGGPAIDRASKSGDPKAFSLPRAMLTHADYNFSFSGLKTALLRTVKATTKTSTADLAASFQEAVVDSLLHKTQKAYLASRPKHLCITGGVSANSRLREKARKIWGDRVLFPPLTYCTDNAAMVACAGFYQWESQPQKTPFSPFAVNVTLESNLG